MKRAIYPAAILCVAVAALTVGFFLGRRSTAAQQSQPDGLVVTAYGSSLFPAEYRGAAAFLLEGKLSEAEAMYNELVQRDEHSAEPYAGLAACRMKESDFAGAHELYEKALVRDPKSVNALIGLGSAYGFQSDYTNAVAAYERVLKVNDQAPEAHWGLAMAYFHLGDNDKAQAHLERFKELQPNSPQIATLQKMMGPSPQPDAAPNAAPPYR
jgi:tetratricopeptide (TPR) repeat protein